jgi:type II restriction enzyme
MKFLDIYKKRYSLSDQDGVFNFLTTSWISSIKYWDYFVNWNKVTKNVDNLEIDLNLLDYLVGKDDVETEFKNLLRKYPNVIRLLPILLACREKEFTILTEYSNGYFVFEHFQFNEQKELSNGEIEKLCRFAKESGLLDIFKKKIVKSVPDYVIGIEVGLDSNGRKSRSGSAMEKIVESFLRSVTEKSGFDYISQADSEKVKTAWGIKLYVDKSDRKFDFIVRIKDKLFLIETNYYGGGGSKLKATAGEYKSLFELANLHGYGFVWITDGLGWQSARLPLREAFDKLDFILNLKMITDGVLDEVLING